MNLGSRYNQHSFAKVPQVNMARSRFDRSSNVKDTHNFDYLNPIFVEEVLPGDTMNLTVKSFMRLATQVVPLLDNMYVDYFFFFVPNRLVWHNWEKFNGAQDDPGDSTDFLIPQVTSVTAPVGSIFDKFGIPSSTGIAINALPFRAYNLIWNEWFRDQNLQDRVLVSKDDGPDAATEYTLLKRGRRHDYFTSALPWPQKGDPVSLPLGVSAPVYGEAIDPTVNGSGIGLQIKGPANTIQYTTGYQDTTAPNTMLRSITAPTGGAQPWNIASAGQDSRVYADLSEATAATINQFRQAIMVQSLLELDARGGTRYVEILRAHFNVVSPDFRLQRPEYLSGGSTRIQQHVIPQTSESGTTPQANLAAYSTAANMSNNIGFSKSFVEHGYVIGLMAARADITYQQGLNKMWSRLTRYDFFWPKLQELGEQAILNKEIYLQQTSADNDVFGYQERYAEYRYKPSEIRGQFRSSYAQTLDVWHLADEYSTLPALNDTFIQSDTPIERSLVLPDPTYPHLLCDFWFDLKHARPMMTYGVPATLGRF